MRTLLLADDNVTVQRVIGLTFATEDVQVLTVSDGQAAIDRIRAQPPDIVLASASMSDVNGYDVATFIRSQPALKSLPVLLLTGAFESVDPARLEISGANGVLEKPLDPAIVIRRVKDLLGLKGDARPNPVPGRLVTPDQVPAEHWQPVQREAPASSQARHTPEPVRASSASSWDELREATGLAPDAPSVEAGHEPGSADYLDTLDAAFDSLDKRLAGRDPRHVERRRHDRRSPPPRTPGLHSPAPPIVLQGAAPNPRAATRRPPEVPAALATYEVDDQWFAGNERDLQQRLTEQKVLAAEMGIRDVELPEDPRKLKNSANDDLDFEFGPDGEPRPATRPPMPATVAPMPRAPGAPTRDVADDFAALLAFEQGEHPQPPALAQPPQSAVVGQAAAPEITDMMLDHIAARVAEKINTGLIGDQLRDAMMATIRETVRAVVSETSERLVRDEIARLKAQAERETR